MNDFVLRGFCECGRQWETIGNKWYVVASIPKQKTHHQFVDQCNPVGSLSPKQMKIILLSKEYKEWCEEWSMFEFLDALSIAHALEVNPFLVAKILKGE